MRLATSGFPSGRTLLVGDLPARVGRDHRLPRCPCRAGDDWFCEAVWEGPFSDGGFDETDIVFGSGVRIRGDRVVFVASGIHIDRLLSVDTPDGVLVSNSLACLLLVRGWRP